MLNNRVQKCHTNKPLQFSYHADLKVCLCWKNVVKEHFGKFQFKKK